MDASCEMQAYSAQELANTAWAYDALKVRSQPLMEAISSQALRTISSMQTQALMFLIDVDLPCHEALKTLADKVVLDFAVAMPLRHEDWNSEKPKAIIAKLHVDSFGTVGTRLLWDRLGVLEAPAEFCLRAEEEIGKVNAEDRAAFISDAEDQVSGRKHQRVFAYAEYEIEPPPGEAEITGKMLFENGFRGVRAETNLLQRMQLPVNSWVDRSLCAEMQMMTMFCCQLAKEGLAGGPELNAMLCGRLLVYTSIPPCLSCVGVLWQFLMNFPGMELQFANGSGCRLESFMKR